MATKKNPQPLASGLVFTMVLCALALLTPQSYAQSSSDEEAEYQTNNTSWKGLGTLVKLAQGMGMQVATPNQLDWDELGEGDVLLLMYPTSNIEPEHLRDYVRNGGKLVLADDYGSGDALLRELGAHRAERVRANEFYENRVFSPLAFPTQGHPLTEGIAHLTTNHPAALTSLEGLQSLYEFSGGQSLVAIGQSGAGSFVLISDPSILINRMLQFENNLRFAIVLLQSLSEGGKTGRLVLMTGKVDLRGQPRNTLDDGTFQGKSAAWIASADSWLAQLNRWLLTKSGLRTITIILALLLGLWLLRGLPNARARPIDGRWTRGASSIAAQRDELWAKLSNSQTKDSYLFPATVEKDTLVTALGLALDVRDPLHTLSNHEITDRVSEKYDKGTAARLSTLLPKIQALPSSSQALAEWQTRYLSKREYERLHDEVAAVIATIEP